MVINKILFPTAGLPARSWHRPRPRSYLVFFGVVREIFQDRTVMKTHPALRNQAQIVRPLATGAARKNHRLLRRLSMTIYDSLTLKGLV
jgi:hypothetical protein